MQIKDHLSDVPCPNTAIILLLLLSRQSFGICSAKLYYPGKKKNWKNSMDGACTQIITPDQTHLEGGKHPSDQDKNKSVSTQLSTQTKNFKKQTNRALAGQGPNAFTQTNFSKEPDPQRHSYQSFSIFIEINGCFKVSGMHAHWKERCSTPYKVAKTKIKKKRSARAHYAYTTQTHLLLVLF